MNNIIEQKNLKLALYAENVPTYDLDDKEALELFSKKYELVEMKILENCVFAQYRSENEALDTKLWIDSQIVKGQQIKVHLVDLHEYEDRLTAKIGKRKHNESNIPIDCYLIMHDKKLNTFLKEIEKKLQEIGLTTTIKYLKNDSLSFNEIIEKIDDKGLIYAIFVNAENEKHGSFSLAVLNDPNRIEAHLNIIVDDAIQFIAEHYKKYMSHLMNLYDLFRKNKRKKVNSSQCLLSTESTSSNDYLRSELKVILNDLVSGVYASQPEKEQALKQIQTIINKVNSKDFEQST